MGFIEIRGPSIQHLAWYDFERLFIPVKPFVMQLALFLSFSQILTPCRAESPATGEQILSFEQAKELLRQAKQKLRKKERDRAKAAQTLLKALDKGAIRKTDAPGGRESRKPSEKEARLLFQAGLRFERTNDYSRALAAYRMLAEHYRPTQASKQARERLAAIENDPKLQAHIKIQKQERAAKGMLQLARNYLNAGKSDLAAKTWREFLERFPNHPDTEKVRKSLEKLK